MHAENRGSRSYPVLVSRQLLSRIESRTVSRILFSKLIIKEEPSPVPSARIV